MSTTSLMQPIGSQGNLKELLRLNKESIAAVVPSYLTPDKVLKVVMLAAMEVPDLLMCTKESILKSIMISAQQGIPIGPQSGYLIPYKNKIKGGDGVPDRWVMEAQFIPDYRGIIAQAKRCNTITRAEAILVYQDDQFEVDWGNVDKPITHKPNYRSSNRGAEFVIAGYFRAKLPDGDWQYDVMTKAELDKIKERSKAKSSGPWVSDPEEMYRKTVTKRGMKYIPSLDERVNLTIHHDNLLEEGNLDAVGMLTDISNAKDVPEGGGEQRTQGQTVVTEDTRTKMDDVAQQVANLRQEQETRQPTPPVQPPPPVQPAAPPPTAAETPAVAQQQAPAPATPPAAQPAAPPSTSEAQPPPSWATTTEQPAAPAPAPAAPPAQPAAPAPQGLWRQEAAGPNGEMIWSLNQELKGGKGKILKDVQFPAVLTKDSEAEAWNADQLSRAQAGLAKVNAALSKNFKLESTVKSWFGVELDKMSSQAMECLIQVLENWK